MSRSTIQTMAAWIRTRAWVLPLYVFITGLMIASLVRMGADFWTNVAVVTEMNIRSFGHPILDFLNLGTLAMLPQFVPVVAFYMALAIQPRNKEETWARRIILSIAIAITLLDVWFGYKWYALDGHNYPFLMAGIVDVLFSEITWTVMFGLFIELKSDAWRETQKLLGLGNKHKPQTQQHQQVQTQSRPPREGMTPVPPTR